jgi:hypothetical protein
MIVRKSFLHAVLALTLESAVIYQRIPSIHTFGTLLPMAMKLGRSIFDVSAGVPWAS